MTESPLVEMRRITKRFPGVLANDQIDFNVAAGEVHALLGENGAGKSTLMSILTGLYRPDEGEIFVRGRKVAFRSPRDAIASGIGMVHQHFRLVHPFTVAENTLLGLTSPRFFLNMREIEKKIAEFSERYGLKVDPRARVWQLSIGEQQRVEIVKMLYRGAEILILDEPTAILTPQEAEELFDTMRKMAAKGHAVIFITHKLREVMAVADRITVLRGGRVIDTMAGRETSEAHLAKMMVGREVLLSFAPRPRGAPTSVSNAPLPSLPGLRGASTSMSNAVLELQDIHALGDKGHQALKGISFTLYKGEILGVAGVAGNGQRELAEVITGLRPSSKGKVFIEGTELSNAGPRKIIDAGVSHIPEDRLGMGLVPNLGAVDNIILKQYRHPTLGRGWFLNLPAARARARQLIADFAVKTPGLDSPVRLLSGGNLQRLLLAREISSDPRMILAVHPTRGLDIGGTEAIHKMLLTQRDAGVAILLISEDLDEILGLSDRVAVLYGGRIMGIVPGEGADVEEIGMMMAGSKTADGYEAGGAEGNI
ncbi:MAG: ABC transporter ATP-binding protein [Syntrophothermus sp.]